MDTPSKNIQQKGIIEMSSNIEELEKQKNSLDGKWDEFKKQYEGISGFLKENLTQRELFEVEEINYIYNSQKKALELKLIEAVKNLQDTSEIKSELLELKKEFYKKLANYIEPPKLNDFLVYIKGDIELNEKNKELKEELYKEKIVLQEKVDTIKEKIEQHQEVINKRIENLIREKLSEKIALLKEKKKFQILSKDGKILFFSKALEKTTSKREILENIENKTSIIQKKIELYQIIEAELIKEREKLQQ